MDPTWAATLSRRLDRHHLTEPATSAAQVAAATCGVHAQILTAAELSIGQRLAGAARDRRAGGAVGDPRAGQDVRAARHRAPAADPGPAPLDRRAGRGAAPAAVVRPVGAAGAGAARRGRGRDRRGAGGRGADDRRARRRARRRGRARGRSSAACRRSRTCGRAGGRRWTPRPTGACSASARTGTGRSPTPARGAGRPGSSRRPGRRRSTWLARSYLHSYGPARPEHFAQWLSAPKPWAATLFETLAAAGEIEPVGERGLGGGRGHGVPVAGRRGGCGCCPTSTRTWWAPIRAISSTPARPRERALARRQAGNYPVLLVDGVVARGLAPEAGRPVRRRHRRAAGRAVRRAAPRSRRGDRADRRVRRPDPASHDRPGGRRSARVSTAC